METYFEKDPGGKKLTITREFNAPLNDVWTAWTQSELLDQWWAPKPWKAQTRSMNFINGGQWLYAMAGPAGEMHWSRVEFSNIEHEKSFNATSYFTDENGNLAPGFEPMHWYNQFFETPTGTKLIAEVSFNTTEGLEQMIQMGFKGGFNMGLSNLDELLAKK